MVHQVLNYGLNVVGVLAGANALGVVAEGVIRSTLKVINFVLGFFSTKYEPTVLNFFRTFKKESLEGLCQALLLYTVVAVGAIGAAQFYIGSTPPLVNRALMWISPFTIISGYRHPLLNFLKS